MNRETLDGWLEKSILGVALLLLVSMPLLFGGAPQLPTGHRLDIILVEPFIVAEWLTVVLLVLWFVRLWVDPKPRLLVPPVCWAVLAFTLYAIGRYWTSDIEYVARQEVVKIMVYACVFFVVVNNLHRQETSQVVVITLITLGMILAFYAVYQFLANSNSVWHLRTPYTGRGSGTYISPNHLGGFLEMIVPLAIAFALMGRFKALPKIGFGYAALSILAAIAVTMSRGAWIATGAALFLFFLILVFYKPYRLPAIVALGVLVAAGFAVVPKVDAFKHRAAQMYSRGKLDDDARFTLWRPALEVWKTEPWFGAGPGHFDYRFREFRPEGVQARPNRAHNDFINTLADLGIVGVAGVMAALALLALGAAKTWIRVRKTPRDLGGNASSTKTAFVLGCIAGLFAILLHSGVDFNMHIPANALLAVTLMALLSGHIRFATDNYWFTAGLWRRMVVSALLLVAITAIAWQGFSRSRESYWLARAARHGQHTTEHVQLLKKAFDADTMNPETAFAIGEALRFQSSQGTDEYETLANEAMEWFKRASKLNPLDGNPLLMVGWCLDWVGRETESWPFYDAAERLNPNSYFTMAYIGLHFVQTGNLPAAKTFFERSIRLEFRNNPIASNYLKLVNDRMIEAAARNAPVKKSTSATKHE